ncbi:hypothetical protein BU16DRAFT_554208 [Lophium mytilinum]|uniref:F-box domain-containing protein n=1 Tax=Lophium mytilinum TaxID=390894 RepID=A0A6A6RCF0_9PEZI|nr:hypothetical protein BU16DRAFT_554208 [Lophium mytilinum]
MASDEPDIVDSLMLDIGAQVRPVIPERPHATITKNKSIRHRAHTPLADLPPKSNPFRATRHYGPLLQSQLRSATTNAPPRAQKHTPKNHELVEFKGYLVPSGTDYIDGQGPLLLRFGSVSDDLLALPVDEIFQEILRQWNERVDMGDDALNKQWLCEYCGPHHLQTGGSVVDHLKQKHQDVLDRCRQDIFALKLRFDLRIQSSIFEPPLFGYCEHALMWAIDEYQSITALPSYGSFSFEEHRLADYSRGNRFSPPGFPRFVPRTELVPRVVPCCSQPNYHEIMFLEREELQSITAYEAFKDISFEELRMRDYEEGRLYGILGRPKPKDLVHTLHPITQKIEAEFDKLAIGTVPYKSRILLRHILDQVEDSMAFGSARMTNRDREPDWAGVDMYCGKPQRQTSHTSANPTNAKVRDTWFEFQMDGPLVFKAPHNSHMNASDWFLHTLLKMFEKYLVPNLSSSYTTSGPSKRIFFTDIEVIDDPPIYVWNDKQGELFRNSRGGTFWAGKIPGLTGPPTLNTPRDVFDRPVLDSRNHNVALQVTGIIVEQTDVSFGDWIGSGWMLQNQTFGIGPITAQTAAPSSSSLTRRLHFALDSSLQYRDLMKSTFSFGPCRSRLLELPKDIRLDILDYLLRPSKTESVDTSQRSVLHPAILRVCKQLHDEGSALYSQNTFAIKERTTWTNLYPKPDLYRLPQYDTFRPNIKHIEFSVTLVNYRPLRYLGADQSPLNDMWTWSTEQSPELIFAYTSRNHPPVNGAKWPFFLKRTNAGFLADDTMALVSRPEYRLAHAAYLRLDHRSLLLPPVPLGLVNLETLTLACGGLEKWMFETEFAESARASAFRTYPLAALLASIIATRPPVKKIILRNVGAAKGELEELIGYVGRGLATPCATSLWHSVSIWNCPGLLGLERGFNADMRVRWGGIGWVAWAERARSVLGEEYEWVFEA